jgi:hypothetical protein
MIPNQSLTCPKGTSLTFEIDMDTGSDLTGATAQWALAESWFDQAKVYLTKTGTGDGLFIGQDSGVWKITVNIAPSDTLDVPSGLLYHDCKVLLQNGDVEDVANGPFILDPSVNVLNTNAPSTRNIHGTQTLGSVGQTAIGAVDGFSRNLAVAQTFGGVGQTAAGVVSPYLSTESAQFFQRVAALPDAARQGLYRNLIDGLVSDGVWAKLDILYIFAAQGIGNASLINLIGPTYTAQYLHLGGGPVTFTEDRGFSNSGAGNLAAIDTTFNRASSTGNYQQNDAMFCAWQYGSASEDSSIVNEIDTSGYNNCFLVSKGTNGENIFTINVAPGGFYTRTAISDSPNGFWFVQRSSSSFSEAFHNNVSIASTTFGSDSSDTGHLVVSPLVNIASSFALGASMNSTLRTAMYNRLHTFMTAVGVA